MGRPPMPVGTHGTIKTTADGEGWRARTSFRDYDGHRREVARWGKTAAEAERNLKTALRDRQTPTSDAITAETKVSKLAEAWQANLAGQDLATNTRDLYADAAGRLIGERIGGLRLREVTVQGLDIALKSIKAEHGHGSAKTARTVLSGMLGYAVRYGAMPTNLARDTSPISRKVGKPIRALTVEESRDVLVGLAGNERWGRKGLDLVDLVDFMLGTGMRIGEACAVRRSVIRDATVEVNATVIRETGRGLFIQERPKTAAGHRILMLTPHLKQLLEERKSMVGVRGPGGVVFCSPRGKLRDPSNTMNDLRDALDELGYDWVTSHVFRKTVATRLDEAGFTPREIADILGHEKPSMTQDVYMGRKVVSARMGDALEPAKAAKRPRSRKVSRE